MNRNALFLAVLGTLLAGCAPGPTVEQLDSMKVGTLEITPKSFDLKTVKNEKGGVAWFRFKNTGDHPVRLSNAKSSCGCSSFQIPDAVAPGTTADIRIPIAPPDTWVGPMVETVTMTTSDPKNPTISLVVKGNYAPVATVDPPLPHQVQFEPGKRLMFRFKIKPRDGMKLDQFETRGGVWKTVPTYQKDGTVDLLMDSVGPMPAGDFYTTLSFVAPDAQRMVTGSITGQAMSGPASQPAKFEAFGMDHAKANVEIGNFMVSSRGKEDVGYVTEVTCKEPELRFEIVKSVGNSVSQVKVFYKGGWAKNTPHYGVFRVKTKPGGPVLEVPYSIVAR